MIMEKRPELVRETDRDIHSPVRHAILDGKIEVLRVMLDLLISSCSAAPASASSLRKYLGTELLCLEFMSLLTFLVCHFDKRNNREDNQVAQDCKILALFLVMVVVVCLGNIP